jgi:GTP-binding protein
VKVKSAQFLESNTQVAKCPSAPFPEYAFIGRSNVGKSSLINMLTNQKHLAKTSGRPGKTQLINHFLINGDWYLVDLPGYGYARASKTDKAAFQKLIERYFKERTQLISAFVLIDVRHPPQPIDLNFMAWLNGKEIPFSIIFTKADKLKPGALDRNISEYILEMKEAGWIEAPNYFLTSSASGIGKEEVLSYIQEINNDFRAAQK